MGHIKKCRRPQNHKSRSERVSTSYIVGLPSYETRAKGDDGPRSSSAVPSAAGPAAAGTMDREAAIWVAQSLAHQDVVRKEIQFRHLQAAHCLADLAHLARVGLTDVRPQKRRSQRQSSTTNRTVDELDSQPLSAGSATDHEVFSSYIVGRST